MYLALVVPIVVIWIKIFKLKRKLKPSINFNLKIISLQNKKL